MATRAILTSQPDVACEVCGRRLLRGEQPDVFIAAGRRRIVCELCAPRAAHEGWMRESDTQSVSLPPMRQRRGRSFFERLRQVARPAGSAAEAPGADGEGEVEPYDFLGGTPAQEPEAAPVAARGRPPSAVVSQAPASAAPEEAPAAGPEAAVGEDSYLQLAVQTFNSSEFPRRVAGVARSLGTPEVSVRSAEHLESVVRIIVAWELSWYRYEVDLSDGPGEAHLLDQGSELHELAREERLANAHAGDSGALTLAG